MGHEAPLEGAEIVVRHESVENAVASAGRLGRKYGPTFAVVRDEMEYGPTFIAPFAGVAPAGWYDRKKASK